MRQRVKFTDAGTAIPFDHTATVGWRCTPVEQGVESFSLTAWPFFQRWACAGDEFSQGCRWTWSQSQNRWGFSA